MSITLFSPSSSGHDTTEAFTPFSLRNLAVPSVAKMAYPDFSNCLIGSSRSTLPFNPPDDTRMFLPGMLYPVAIIAFSNASLKSSPRHPTSPVDDISTPSTGSAFCRRANENCEAFTPMRSMSNSLLSGRSYGASSMMRVAVSMKLRLRILLTKGNERDARRLHSITLMSLPLARY